MPKIPSHWLRVEGDPSAGCEFELFARKVFGPVTPGWHLGRCGSGSPTSLRVLLTAPGGMAKARDFILCSHHRGLAMEAEAQAIARYRVVE